MTKDGSRRFGLACDGPGASDSQAGQRDSAAQATDLEPESCVDKTRQSVYPGTSR